MQLHVFITQFISQALFSKPYWTDYATIRVCQAINLNLDLEDPDEQCAFNRSGILCGACQHNLSHVFGTSTCQECSSMCALLWVPVIALVGLAE